MKSSKPQMVKQNNLAYLTQLVKNNAPLSKRELADLSKLSVVTINKLIPELLEKKMIYPYSNEVVTGGRHAVSYRFNEQKNTFLVIKIVENRNELSFFFYLCDLVGKIIKEEELPIADLSWEDFVEVIGEWKRDYPEINSIVLGIPGVEMNGIVKVVDHPMLQGKSVQEELTEKFDCQVTLENDVNAAVLGYAMREPKEKIISGIYYPVEFPPGGGVSIYQKILKGRNNFVGEVSVLPLEVDWSKENILKVDLTKHLLDMMEVFISLYDPHEVVVYGTDERINEEVIHEVGKKIVTKFPLIELPTIHLSRYFKEDYLAGLIQIGLEETNRLLLNEFK
ncbi:ROK family protein [Vagococcus hydrophili]|uniref:ROK family protein n=1 Tax=Vagococcus hydrophili TaxID=2714947 RepID=A0A6G8AT64_9ENTE|nr:ROK family protein [Vagococcus hydrophili]QIL48132.1 ROK family protein [Vagococcus hydrophili]